MKANELTPGANFSAEELGSSVKTYTIQRVVKEVLKAITPGKPDQEKGVVYLREIAPRGWVMNSTNVQCLAAMFGDETDNWLGKKVTLHTEMVSVGTSKELGIRVTGSPDIKGPINAEIRLKRKAPTTRKLVPTGQAAPPPPTTTRPTLTPAQIELVAYFKSRPLALDPPLSDDEKRGVMDYFGDGAGAVKTLSAMDDAAYNATMAEAAGRGA